MTEVRTSGKLPAMELVYLRDGPSKRRPMGYDRVVKSDVAELVMHLVSGSQVVPDGETTSGDQKFRVLTPEEVVERAVALAELTFERLIARGHVAVAPTYDDLPDETAPMGFAAASSRRDEEQRDGS
jgi:hypothetical protein